MTFLQPWLLWGLAAALVPVAIHLLNRLRFRSVRWAAMMFLVSAARSSTRHARLRHYLILLCRCLLLALLAAALARPLLGGWLGLRLAGNPDTVMVLLDRSASMESVDPRRQTSKRDHALALVAAAAREGLRGSRFVLIDSATLAPQELADPSALTALDTARATDTAADLPALFQAALDAVLRGGAGRTELWVLSDLRRADWRPDSGDWPRLRAQLAALPQGVQVRLLALAEPERRNAAIALQHAERLRAAAKPQLDLALELARTGAGDLTVPLTLTLDGERSQADVTIESASLAVRRRLPLPGDAARSGWGKAEIPADENARDNAAYFVYGSDVRLDTAVVAEDPEARRYAALAAAPAPAALNQSAATAERAEAARLPWADLACLVWQGRAPETSTVAAVEAFVEAGGAVLCLPPAEPDAPGVFGLTWGAVQEAETAAPFRVSTWDELDGPLARTAGGLNLPVAALGCQRRQLCRWDTAPAAAAGWFALARYADGQPFLLRARRGRGEVYALTTLPGPAWSQLGTDGAVWVPMVQRIVRRGAARLQQVELGVCGRWRPAAETETWTAVDAAGKGDWRVDAGVYACGPRRVAMNRPADEFLPDALEAADVRDLLAGIPLRVLEDGARRRTDRLQTEVWRACIVLALLCALLEAWLVLQEYQRARAAAPA